MKTIFDSIIALVKGNINDRKLLVWGAWEIGWELAETLKKNHLEFYAYVDSRHYGKDYKGYPVISPDDLHADSKSEYYCIISLVEHTSVYKALTEISWTEFDDFVYCGKTVHLTSCINYEDIYGNRVESKICKNLEIKMSCGSRLIIEEGVHIGKNVRIEVMMLSEIWIQKGAFISDNSYISCREKSKIIIGSECHFGNNLRIECSTNASIVLNSKCRFRRNCFLASHIDAVTVMEKQCEFGAGTIIRSGYDSEIRIGSRSTFNDDTIMKILHSSAFECGVDCMFSYCTRIRGESGHAIIDMKNHKIMERKKNVKLGNHVWVGMGVTIFPGTEMGDNSIIGANSLVNHVFPSNCIVIGSPARIHKTDVTWDRDVDITYEKWEEQQKYEKGENENIV